METEGRTEINNTAHKVEEIRGIPSSWMRCDWYVSAEEAGKVWTDFPAFVEEDLIIRTEVLELNFQKCKSLVKKKPKLCKISF